ncbi:MAG TPA: hypothetical protein VF079_00955 [Sphingomicrobium sp.]
MRVSKLRLAAVALIGGITLGGCAYGFGDPYGSYGGLGVGYGNYGYGGYGDPYGYGYGYGYPGGYGYYGNPYGGYGNYLGYGYGGYPYGWYNGYYYPGTGYYVYDGNHHRRQITDAERQYWRDKFARYRSGSTSGTTVTTSSITPRENWSGFKRVRTRTVDTSNSNDNRGSDRGFWRRGSSSQSSSQSSTSSSNSSDFMRRHSPHRQKD